MSRSKIANHALISALCPLIPLPLVDEWALGRTRAQLFASIGRTHELTLGREDLRTLARSGPFSPLGCLATLLIWPFKKLFKTLLFFLLIKECLDVATETLHRGEMLSMAAEQGLLKGNAVAVKAAMDKVCRAQSISPVRRGLLREARPPLPERVPTAPAYQLQGFAGRLQAWGGGGIVLREFERELSVMREAVAEEPSP